MANKEEMKERADRLWMVYYATPNETTFKEYMEAEAALHMPIQYTPNETD